MNQLLINRINKVKKEVESLKFGTVGDVYVCASVAAQFLEGAIKILQDHDANKK